jgi:hypothetical protein
VIVAAQVDKLQVGNRRSVHPARSNDHGGDVEEMVFPRQPKAQSYLGADTVRESVIQLQSAGRKVRDSAVAELIGGAFFDPQLEIDSGIDASIVDTALRTVRPASVRSPLEATALSTVASQETACLLASASESSSHHVLKYRLDVI